MVKKPLPSADDPNISGYTLINVTDHGITPNDNTSDTEAIRTLFRSVNSRSIIYFPAGVYDVFMEDDTDKSSISLQDNGKKW